MAASLYTPLAFIPYLTILLLFIHTTTLSQDPTVAQCATRLLPLATCAPFVQGMTQSPSQPCCLNLQQLYTTQPHCLCLLLNDTTLSSYPINSTLALQLPLLCNLQVNLATCSGVENAPISPGMNSSSPTGNLTVAAPPMFQPAATPTTVGMGTSGSGNIKASNSIVAMALPTLLLIFKSAMF